MLCVSQASTAICLSMDNDEASSSLSSLPLSNTRELGGKTIDRHNPIIRDGRRAAAQAQAQPTPLSPKSFHQTKKVSKPSSSNSQSSQNDQKRKSATNNSQSKLIDRGHSLIGRKRWGMISKDLVTPPGSSRYLLGDDEQLSVSVSASALERNNNTLFGAKDCSTASAPSSSSSCSHDQSKAKANQVVVLRVSLHCKGCEGKVRKHLSRMEGVTSFNIDFAAKKVTVVGDVSPVSVLASISKVKNAQILSSAAPMTVM